MAFFNLRIRGRLYGGFSALILFCAGLAGFAVYQLWGISDQVRVMTMQSKNAIRFTQFQRMDRDFIGFQTREKFTAALFLKHQSSEMRKFFRSEKRKALSAN